MEGLYLSSKMWLMNKYMQSCSLIGLSCDKTLNYMFIQVIVIINTKSWIQLHVSALNNRTDHCTTNITSHAHKVHDNSASYVTLGRTFQIGNVVFLLLLLNKWHSIKCHTLPFDCVTPKQPCTCLKCCRVTNKGLIFILMSNVHMVDLLWTSNR